MASEHVHRLPTLAVGSVLLRDVLHGAFIGSGFRVGVLEWGLSDGLQLVRMILGFFLSR